MRTHTMIISVLAAGALAVSACGDDEPGGSASGADRESELQDARLAYAQCMRENGVDVPDPQVDGGRVLQQGPREQVPEETLRAAEEACREHLEDAEPPEIPEAQQEEFREAALAHARCMREHGIENFPDPQFGEGGRATMRIGPDSGIKPNSSEFREAQEACQDELPQAPSGGTTP